ncbi:hypothetical protein [Tenacibaculum dicentrarchi]|uniref:hypothetical protein n=1 Tax=Tenacibaculum dicentrarchi TaxID=669041 RepID=UPI0011AEFABB
MKKKLLIAILLISNITFGQNFPGSEVNLLLNKEIRVKEKDKTLQKYGYSNFFKNEKLKKKFNCCESYNSKYAGLVGKVFKVLSAKPYKNIIGTEKYKLKIENPETGIIYFDYDQKYEHSFPFEVIGGLDLPEDFYCKKIKTTTDKFDGKTTSRTDYSEGVSFIKITKDNSSKIYMSINEIGSTLNVGKKGLILLLENGKKINRPNAKLNTRINKGGRGYIYSAFIKLTQEEIKLIIENKITDNRLYIYDGEIKNGEKFGEYLKCLNK